MTYKKIEPENRKKAEDKNPYISPITIAKEKRKEKLKQKKANLETLNQAVQELTLRERYGGFINYFPEEDNIHPTNAKRRFYSRWKYPKQLDFFIKGKTFKQRAMIAANRSGKTVSFGFELVQHLTGLYMPWWEGKKFTRPTQWWIVGINNKTVKEILQPLLLGDVTDFGSGLIPKHLIDFESMTDAKKASTRITTFKVKHTSGQYSTVEFKSCEEGAAAFQGTERCIWIDEECPEDVYNECLIRTMTTDDILVMTFTPLNGLTPLLMNYTNDGDYVEGDKGGGRWLTNLTWDDIPHLTDEAKDNILKSTAPWLRDARSKGIPTIGEGLVIAYPEDKWFIDPFSIPTHWKRVFAWDYGWAQPSAGLWMAIDPETDIYYLYHEHYQKMMVPEEHVKHIKAQNHGANMKIPAVADPSGGGTSIRDGKTAKEDFHDLGIYFTNADNSRQAGIVRINGLLVAGKLKAFNHLVNLKRECRLYKTKSNGKFSDTADHLIDCVSGQTKILTSSGTKEIKDINIGDQVWTRKGLKKVTDTKIISNNKLVYKIITNNGKEIFATGNHKFLVNNEWQSVEYMFNFLKDKKCDLNSNYIMENSTEDTQIVKGQQIESTSKIILPIFIDKFMKIFSEKFRKNIKSIIKTMIPEIVIHTILNYYHSYHMPNIMNQQLVINEGYNENYGWTLSEIKQKNGTLLQKVYDGIETMPKKFIRTEYPKSTIAPNVLEVSQQNTDIQNLRTDFVAPNVKTFLKNPKLLEVLTVDQNKVISSLDQLLITTEYVISVEEDHIATEVYDITVEDEHEFFANGILVHNCLRYLVMTGYKIATSPEEQSLQQQSLVSKGPKFNILNHVKDGWMYNV